MEPLANIPGMKGLGQLQPYHKSIRIAHVSAKAMYDFFFFFEKKRLSIK